jgi:HlyD family secretion protein
MLRTSSSSQSGVPLEVTAEAAGLIEPIRLVEVKSKASGEITALHVETGDAVKRGDLLGRSIRVMSATRSRRPKPTSPWRGGADGDREGARRALQELRKANVITEQEYESATLEEANARAQWSRRG